MRFSQAMRTIIDARDYTQDEYARLVGVSRQSVTQMLRKGNPTVNAMDRYLSPLGYRVVLVPVGARVPDGSYPLEGVRE